MDAADLRAKPAVTATRVLILGVTVSSLVTQLAYAQDLRLAGGAAGFDGPSGRCRASLGAQGPELSCAPSRCAMVGGAELVTTSAGVEELWTCRVGPLPDREPREEGSPAWTGLVVVGGGRIVWAGAPVYLAPGETIASVEVGLDDVALRTSSTDGPSVVTVRVTSRSNPGSEGAMSIHAAVLAFRRDEPFLAWETLTDACDTAGYCEELVHVGFVEVGDRWYVREIVGRGRRARETWLAWDGSGLAPVRAPRLPATRARGRGRGRR